MAQTLTSTSAADKPISRTTSSVRSVSIDEVFFGRDTQRHPVFDRQVFHLRKSAFKTILEVAKPRMKSISGARVVVWAVSARGCFRPIWPILGWGVGLAIHGWMTYFQKPIGEDDIRL